jgi:protein-disulfide isomerase
MRMLSKSVLCLVLVAVAASCQRQDEETQKKLDYLISKVEGLEKKVAAGGGARPAVGAPGQPQPQQPQRPQRPAPEPTAVYGVDVTGDPFLGPADAKVTIVKASEYACPFCQRVNPTLEQLRKDYPNDVRIVYKNYVVHPDRATAPALAACAAQQQGKFEKFDHLIWDEAFGKDTSEAKMIELAGKADLNVNKFKADMASDDCKQDIANDQKILSAVGVSGTPAFYINGRYLSGARPIEQFKALVDEELKKANDTIGRGEAAPATYYQKMVVEKGKKAL